MPSDPAIRLASISTLGPFSWRWPEGVEHFDLGWTAVAEVDGNEVHVRHGVTERFAYGRDRPRSVTWVEGQPMVEGVGADDFERSGSLLSLIKVTKRHVRPGDPVPEGYRSFPVVVMADEAAGPYSPRSLAIKLPQDDIEGWTQHALLRAISWGRLRRETRQRTSLPPVASAGPAPASAMVAAAGDARGAVVAALLAYARNRPHAPPGSAVEFTPDRRANQLLRDNAFAFLMAVLFDQGIPAERAWLAPYLLQTRLGHLDPGRIAADEDRVASAIVEEPKLHRYVNKVPRWLVLAAKRVIDEYGGDAGAIWSGAPAAHDLQRRFDDFKGIGQKKAAMAVEILERDMGVPVRNLERSDVAYDVHLRRVFLRTRLADRDDPDHMIAMARQLYPTRPGELDFPSWLIGRGWCHPGLPDCASCPLTNVCPKDIERAAQVTSG